MKNTAYIFGPVPSRRLGQSLGVSPIPEKTCNYNCIYCQLGRTNKMTNERRSFFPLKEIMDELKTYMKEKVDFDVITIVGEGEPTLYADLGMLIDEIKKLTDKPVVVITNSALMSDEGVRNALYKADIILPTMDAFDEESLKKINRPIGTIKFTEVLQGLIEFSHNYKGKMWVEIMLVGGFNDSDTQLAALKMQLEKLKFDRVYVNTPVRPPSESYARKVSQETLEKANKMFSALSIENLTAGEFFSNDPDIIEAVLEIITRHPMKEDEIKKFIEMRNEDVEKTFTKLRNSGKIDICEYEGEKTYRHKK
ncbi:radical SAM protein [Desulforhopalus vacuolatus]|uniref:radical SAM protein n=1 Tax=Desulforhopalus vacuolatus TaxID=40414 RepID=UPI001965C306|nr:radical SAM protein [Desulforhopalus vacuolatus]MBM9519848.1 radical SAM protein [Desulforhopalus vacuolatus]